MNKTKALYTLIGLANKAKDIGDYKLSNLTFGLIVASGIRNFRVVYEDADDELSAYYDLISIHINDRCLCIPVPLLGRDALAECLKRAEKIERLEHNRQYSFFENWDDWKRSFDILASRYRKIVNEYFDINVISTALWALDMPKEFEEWCFNFLSNEKIVPSELLVN